MGKFWGKVVGKSRSEHDNELRAKKLATVRHDCNMRVTSAQERAISRLCDPVLTAMSGLSARVSSWGGEGAFLGRGGEALGGGAATLVAFFAFWNMGASFFTSSSGADESPLLSESDILAVAVL